MENRKRSDDRIIQLITLSEEISNMSVKVKQLIEDLHGTPEVLAGAKEITNSLNGKVGSLQADLNSYAPLAPEKVVDTGDPSWSDGINERERIVPTPQNMQDYMPIREAASSSIRGKSISEFFRLVIFLCRLSIDVLMLLILPGLFIRFVNISCTLLLDLLISSMNAIAFIKLFLLLLTFVILLNLLIY